MSKKILVVGSTNTDMVVKAARLPRPGETALGGTFLMNAGGKGANQAVAAARLGAQVAFVCKTGNDIFGQQAKQLFASEGIDTSFVFSDAEHPSGVALITVDAQEKTVSWWHRAPMRIYFLTIWHLLPLPSNNRIWR